MIVVDSSVWIDWIAGRETLQVAKLAAERDPRRIIVGDIVLTEVLMGARSDGHAEQLAKLLRTFRVAAMADPDIAVRAAAHYRKLRSLGFTIRRTTDLIIGAFCIAHGHTLLHSDRDFDPMVEHLGLKAL